MILVPGHRAIDVILASFVPARGHPADVHIDAVAVNDRRDRIEEGESLAAGFGGDRRGQCRAGQRPGGDDRGMIGEGVDALADHDDVGVSADPLGDFAGEGFAVDRERGASGNPVQIRARHDQRAEIAHFLMDQADGIILGIVGAEAVGAHHFGERVGVMGGGGVAPATHLGQPHAQARFGQLPRGLRSGEATADDVDVVSHDRRK